MRRSYLLLVVLVVVALLALPAIASARSSGGPPGETVQHNQAAPSALQLYSSAALEVVRPLNEPRRRQLLAVAWVLASMILAAIVTRHRAPDVPTVLKTPIVRSREMAGGWRLKHI